MKKEISVIGSGIVIDRFGEEKEVNIIPFICNNIKSLKLELDERDTKNILIAEDYLFIIGMVISVTKKTTIMDEDEQFSTISCEIIVIGNLSEDVIHDLQGKVLERVGTIDYSRMNP